MAIMECGFCDGRGLINRSFAPDPAQPSVRRQEVLRCSDCGGLGIKEKANPGQ